MPPKLSLLVLSPPKQKPPKHHSKGISRISFVLICSISHPYGIRTRVSALRTRRLNPLTNGQWVALNIVPKLFYRKVRKCQIHFDSTWWQLMRVFAFSCQSFWLMIDDTTRIANKVSFEPIDSLWMPWSSTRDHVGSEQACRLSSRHWWNHR